MGGGAGAAGPRGALRAAAPRPVPSFSAAPGAEERPLELPGAAEEAWEPWLGPGEQPWGQCPARRRDDNGERRGGDGGGRRSVGQEGLGG